MMATEATSDNIAPSSTLLDNELNTTETAIHDVSPDSERSVPTINGDIEKDGNKPDTEQNEQLVVSAEVSVSGGSDTEASKAETSKIAGEEKGHARTTSTVKKFASFKPVSVNKTFLAAKGATSATPSKLGDKAAAATTSQTTSTTASRPRLVAKSASGVRDSSPRTATSANGGKPGAAPDASAVWNKNRPAPAPEPKRFTDEELKQRYGIHLATRLQSDDPGKQANWADIDDDDDDWAPETIEWTDGTKITLPQAEDPPAPIREPSPVPVVKETKILDVVKPKSPAPIQSSASPTIKPSGFGGRTGLILKGASEKPTLVAKPPGPPTPVKSPWASLPPVEKVAPVMIDIPQNQQSQSYQGRFTNQRDPHGFQGMPPPPAKEIAADDFSRSSWRESHGGNNNRTLFNSQSGGYEPVNDNRRGSRMEASNRGPAVLQRPSQQDGPAEPSPAFQTHRANGPEGVYGRRRTSSNVSGNSGNFTRRMSRGHDMPPPHEMLAARRGSLAAVSDAPSSPRNFSPSGQHPNQRGYQNPNWQSRASPVVSHSSPQSGAGQLVPPGPSTGDNQVPPQTPFEDPVEEQKKIMRQARELAIKRRQEEEAQEEAARKERLRLKLEAMGPAPEKKKDKKEVVKDEKPVPTQIQTREPTEIVSQAKPDSGNQQKLDNLNHNEVQTQQPSLVNKSEPKVLENSLDLDSRPNGLLHQPASAMANSNHTAHEGKVWQNTSSSNVDRYQAWAPPSVQQSSSRNVWGPPPSNERPLGNGTFNPDFSRLPESQSQSSHPGPIGPPGRGSGRGRDYGARPNPIAPPTRQSAATRDQQQRVAASGWADLPEKLAREDAQFRIDQEAALAQKRELQASGALPEDAQPVFKDTWRKITLNEDGTRSKVQATIASVHDTSGQWKVQEENAARSVDRRQDATQPQFNDAWNGQGMTSSAPARGSRFFPNNNRDVRLEDPMCLLERPASPPPPTMAGHPAYDGDSTHPLVSLPRPAPVVKLPPAVLAPIGPPKPASFAAAVTSPAPPPVNNSAPQGYFRRGSQDIRNDSSGEAKNWQDRISSLLGRKSSPPKTSNALAVDSSSKHALELPISQNFATVSLPSSTTGDLAADNSSVISKPAAEECFAEQEMGSLPTIKVPNHAPTAAWVLHPAPKVNPRRFPPAAISSAESFKFEQTLTEEQEEKHRRAAIHILLPGQESKSVVRVQTRQRSNSKPRGNRNGTRPASSSQRGRGNGRETSSSFPSPSVDSASATSSPNSRAGGYRSRGRGNAAGGRGQDWNRHPAPVQG